jgi:hypothetical protein
MMPAHSRARIAIALAALAASGCVSRPPTIAHVHIGHAITGVHVTPDHAGYLSTAEKRAREALDLASKAEQSESLPEIKTVIEAASKASNSDEEFGVKHALVLAVNHVSFAATSDDASLNVQRSAPLFAAHSTKVVERCELIGLLAKDVQASTSVREAKVSVDQIKKLADANLNGDSHGAAASADSSATAGYGLVQLRQELDAMIAREKPPYRMVDHWYLFNLVRLPSGRWVFDKLSRGGNIEGYK